MAGWVAQVARVPTEHGDWWMAWGDGGLVACARTRPHGALELTTVTRRSKPGNVAGVKGGTLPSS